MITIYNNPQSTYYALSNFSNHAFHLGGEEWPTAQHYIEAQKFQDPQMKQTIRQLATPEEAVALSTSYELPTDECEQQSVYLQAMLAKVYAYPHILSLLLTTDDQIIDGEDDVSQIGFLWQIIRSQFRTIAILESEQHVKNVCVEDLIERHQLIRHLEKLPVDAFSKLRHLQPEIGCFNRCSFCSQSAGTNIWSLNLKGLKNLFSALKTVGIQFAQRYQLRDGTPYLHCYHFLNEETQTFDERFVMPQYGLIGYARHSHRPGVIFPYLDNDIGTYPYLKQFIQYASEDLGVRVRLSTVGYSRKSQSLQRMHEAINEEVAQGVAGVRLSLTPYTYGYNDSPYTSREDFKEDVINFLATYKPLMDTLGPGQRSACVEFRFKPLMEDCLTFREVDTAAHHIIAVGPYALVSYSSERLKVSDVRVDETRQMHIEGQGLTYTMIQSDHLRDVDATTLASVVSALLAEKTTKKYPVKLYMFENEDGIYYATNPKMTDDGMRAKQFYPPTKTRPSAGYIDSERYFMNSVVFYKKMRGRGVKTRRDHWDEATWSDVAGAVHYLMAIAEDLEAYNVYAATYIREEILPLVQLYAEALLTAGYPPSHFFLSTFTIDTGSICNLGKAYATFRHLASRPHMPLTPQQERAFGKSSMLSLEGQKWRISVSPHSDQVLRDTTIGPRNLLATQNSLLIEREDLSLRSVGGASGMADRRHLVPFTQVDMYKLDDGRARLVGAK